jgi:hypothetical protein
MTDVLSDVEKKAKVDAFSILKQFLIDLGPDPLKIPLTLSPAVAKATAQATLDAAADGPAAWQAIQTDAVSRLDAAIAKVNAA